MRILTFAVIFFLLFACSKSEEPTNSESDDKPTNEEPSGENSQENPEESLFSFEGVSPLMVDLGDTLRVNGQGFNKNVRITVGDRFPDLIFNNDSIIDFQIPYWGFNPDPTELKIDNLDTIVTLEGSFELYPPVIDSIPSNFGFRDTVVVYGKHLTNHPQALDGIIELNGERLEVISQSKDSIKFLLPYNVQQHENDLLVNAQLQQIFQEKSVIIPDPIISGVSKDSLLVGERLAIYGSNFYPTSAGYNRVFIDGKETEVLESYADSLIVNVPLGPYSGRDIGEVIVRVLQKEIQADLDLYLKNKWYVYDFKNDTDISGASGVGEISRQSFYYNNAFYFNVYDYIEGYQFSSSSNYKLYKYTPETKNWERQADLPVLSSVGNGESIQLFHIGNGELYIYVNRETDNFYRYNVDTQSSTKLTDFDSEYRLGDAVGFAQNGNFYMGAGSRRVGSSSYTGNRKFWKYEVSTDSWSEISEIPEVAGQYQYAYHSNFFQKDGKVYVCNGDRAYETWEFTPDDTWIRKSDLESPVSQTVFTQDGDYGYFYHYYERLIWQYDLIGDTWTRREDLGVEGYNFGRETMFIHDGFIYLVGYQSGWPPDPTGWSNYDHIILRTEL